MKNKIIRTKSEIKEVKKTLCYFQYGSIYEKYKSIIV